MQCKGLEVQGSNVGGWRGVQGGSKSDLFVLVLVLVNRIRIEDEGRGRVRRRGLRSETVGTVDVRSIVSTGGFHRTAWEVQLLRG
jgi:hypothetical protein